MPTLNAEPLIEQLQRVDAAYQYLLSQINAAEGKAATARNSEHTELMNRIAQARQQHFSALVELSYRLRVQLERDAGY
ncbi:hypothetical protein OH708_20095 [Pseudomonas capsici]|uniref:hypothetical protein n=1 Tax=Pseudomonas capsici TaxID=2810614 RepID=UPI001910C3F4|nr:MULTISPECIES: hypothetical protein [Pseudomonas]MBX8614683.1 hypothetical protein [Pseudomonas cichorii]MCV4290217.1 hypothetical protein [Pseudomonas capsici]GFM58696.1 hypothetical protein PSCICF_48740 [Pseudomonas cichorii]GFM63407.1 hypothetical protein PSCICG_45670 [Pseudomonas cichorii]GFM73378.1 hypothetical protein PSCICL_43700 [Pseudomonas cichorii]